jgi:hypothetical protein
LDSGHPPIIFQRYFGQKYFVQNGRRQEWTKELDPLFLDIFLDIKMSILPFARGSFENTKRETPKIGFVTIMLSKRIFGIKKL